MLLSKETMKEQCPKALPKPAWPEQSIVEMVEALTDSEATNNLSDHPRRRI